METDSGHPSLDLDFVSFFERKAKGVYHACQVFLRPRWYPKKQSKILFTEPIDVNEHNIP